MLFTKIIKIKKSHSRFFFVLFDLFRAFVYCHFVAQSSTQKNDISFVVAVWMKLANNGFFDGVMCLEIYSDGGHKHFKSHQI